jgi:hypothetical protein
MALSYQRFTEEEDKLRNLIVDGEYPAYIESITKEKTKGGLDKKGQPKPIYDMAVIDLIITDMNGRERPKKDWVMLEGPMAWKFRHLAIACNCLEQYDNDTLTLHHLLRKEPSVKITTGKWKNDKGEEVMINNVADYLKPPDISVVKSDMLSDDIPY